MNIKLLLANDRWKVIKDTTESTIVALEDTPENILRRITFYDVDSRPIQKALTDRERRHYLREIKRDMTYFRRSYSRAYLTVNIAGWSPEEASLRIKDLLMRELRD